MKSYKVKDAPSNASMDEQYKRELKSYKGTDNYGKKINSGAKSNSWGASAHSVSGCMGYGKKY
jgi:hypothetical protein